MTELEYGPVAQALWLLDYCGFSTRELAQLTEISETEITAALDCGPEPHIAAERVLQLGGACAHVSAYADRHGYDAARAWLHAAPAGDTRTRLEILIAKDRCPWQINPDRELELRWMSSRDPDETYVGRLGHRKLHRRHAARGGPLRSLASGAQPDPADLGLEDVEAQVSTTVCYAATAAR